VYAHTQVFTRFCNTHLEEQRQIELGSLLNSALDDGFRLWYILKHIADEELPKLSPPKMRIHKLQNLEICLQFLIDKGVKMVGIGTHGTIIIANSHVSRYSGSQWQAHFGVNLDHYFEVPDGWVQHEGGQTRDCGLGRKLRYYSRHQTRVQTQGSCYSPLSLDSGSMLVELVNGILPGAITDDMLSNDVEKNTRLAMETAHSLLGIAQIVEAEDLLDVNKDDKVILTYLSLFKEAVSVFLFSKNAFFCSGD
jgi:hypothetical protein